MTIAWGVLWRSQNQLDGKTERLVGDASHPCHKLLFRSRREARGFIAKRYGYIRDRPDLRAEPYGWKMPLAIPVHVHIEAQQ